MPLLKTKSILAVVGVDCQICDVLTAFGVKALYKGGAGSRFPRPFPWQGRRPARAGRLRRPGGAAAARGVGLIKDIPWIPGAMATRAGVPEAPRTGPAKRGERRGRRPRRWRERPGGEPPPRSDSQKAGAGRTAAEGRRLYERTPFEPVVAFRGGRKHNFSYVSPQGERRGEARATNDNAALSLVARSRAIGFLIGAGCLARSARGRRRVEAASGAGTEPLSRFPREMTGAARAVAAYKGPWPGEAGGRPPAAAGSRPGRRRGVRGAPSRPGACAGPCPVRGPPEGQGPAGRPVRGSGGDGPRGRGRGSGRPLPALLPLLFARSGGHETWGVRVGRGSAGRSSYSSPNHPWA